MRKRWIQIDGQLVPVENGQPRPRKAPHIIGSFSPYRATTGDRCGEIIHSRREHREFLKRNNLQEVGNEYSYMTRHGGMTADNPNLVSDEQYEEEVCKDLTQTLEQLRR